MTALTIKVRSKQFGDHQVLGQITVDIPVGQRVALLGPSGVGKSTLLSIIAGLDTDFDGTLNRPEGQIAMIFQNPRLLPWRTLTQNIALIPNAGGEDRARQLLAEVGLAEAADQHPEKVSLGMQRRAALARAMAVSPTIMLMDEPLVSLDPDAAKGMRELLRNALDKTSATALFATHDRHEALSIADRVLEMNGQPAGIVRDRLSPLDRSHRTMAAVTKLQREWFDA